MAKGFERQDRVSEYGADVYETMTDMWGHIQDINKKEGMTRAAALHQKESNTSIWELARLVMDKSALLNSLTKNLVEKTKKWEMEESHAMKMSELIEAAGRHGGYSAAIETSGSAVKIGQSIVEAVSGMQEMYVVVEVVPTKDKPYKISGSVLRIANWLADYGDGVESAKVVKFSSDRNWTRQQADEV